MSGNENEMRHILPRGLYRLSLGDSTYDVQVEDMLIGQYPSRVTARMVIFLSGPPRMPIALHEVQRWGAILEPRELTAERLQELIVFAVARQEYEQAVLLRDYMHKKGYKVLPVIEDRVRTEAEERVWQLILQWYEEFKREKREPDA